MHHIFHCYEQNRSDIGKSEPQLDPHLEWDLQRGSISKCICIPLFYWVNPGNQIFTLAIGPFCAGRT
nr:hypothetical protein Q903MT_gene6028 [Picea sitchensis]